MIKLITPPFSVIKTLGVSLILTLFLMMNSAQVQAQSSKLDQLKMAYFTNTLNWSGDQMQAFWPIYWDFQKELKAAKDKVQQNGELSKATKDLSLKEVDLEVRKKWNEKFKAKLSDNQIGEFYQAEKDFWIFLNGINK